MPHLCMIFEATGPFNAIGRIAMAEVEAALDVGWRVSVVAHRLCDSLQDRVEWLPLYNPPRGFVVKWLTARHFIKKAVGDPSRFDLIHGHQPQVSDLCDVFECHYLTRAAMERGCRDARRGWRGWLARAQESIILRAEDRIFRAHQDTTRYVFGSELTRSEFSRLYGTPAQHEVQVLPAPVWNPANHNERRDARREFVGEYQGPVVGFLGGMNERKGYRVVMDSATESEGLFLLIGGSHSEQICPPAQLRGRYKALGLVDNVDRFYAAIDVLLVPSVFEPFGLVCFEAAARGVPVIATDSVGALSAIEPYGVARCWGKAKLEDQVRDLLNHRDSVKSNCKTLVDAHSRQRFNEMLISRYEQVLSDRSSLFSHRAPHTGGQAQAL